MSNRKPPPTPIASTLDALRPLYAQVGHLLTADTGRDLTARQLAVLLHIHFHPMDPPSHTVRGIALEIGLNKPAITRAVDRLAECGLVARDVDVSDLRSVLVRLTKKGRALLDALAKA